MNAFVTPMGDWLVKSTLYGSGAILIILLVSPFVRRWFGARAAHLLWLTVLVKLVIPWSPSLPEPLISAPVKQFTQTVQELTPSFKVSVAVETPPPTDIPRKEQSGSHPDVRFWLLSIWAAGVAGMLALLMIRSVRAARLVGRSVDISDRSEIKNALSLSPPFPRNLRIRETVELRSPSLSGLWRPAILLPAGWISDVSAEELRCVLAHELGHMARKDLWWKWAFQIVCALHWFNSLVWLAERMSRADQEMACDEWVLSRRVAPPSERYGEALLSATRRLRHPALTSPVRAGMAESKFGLARRMRHLANFRVRGPMGFILILLIVTGVSITVGAGWTVARSIPVETPAPVPISSASQPSGDEHLKRPRVELDAKFAELSPEAVKEVFGQNHPAILDKTGNPNPILTSKEFGELVAALVGRKDVSFLSAPKATMPSGQSAIVRIAREFPYPTQYEPSTPPTPSAFETEELGVSIEFTPYLDKNDWIQCTVNPRIVEFLGFIDYGAGHHKRTDLSGDAISDAMKSNIKTNQVINQPIFQRRELTTSVALRSGQTVMIGALNAGAEAKPFPPVPFDQVHDSTPEGKGGQVYIFLTAHIIEPDGRPRASAAPGSK
jgi:beta-lactamase regulating signal transducer with metallopeptidase domain